VQVEGGRDRAGELLDGLRRGEFYASTGPEFNAVSVTAGQLQIEAAEDGEFTVIVAGGEASTVSGPRLSYRLPETGYVRARFRSDRGLAWTQPVSMNS